MRQYPSGIRSVGIDGILPPSIAGGVATWASAAEGINAVFKACHVQSPCRQRYGDIAATFRLLVIRYEASPKTFKVEVPGYPGKVNVMISGGMLVQWAVSPGTHIAAKMPASIAALAHGDPGPIASTGGLIVLPGYDRHVVISMQTGMFVTDWHSRKFFAGTLPDWPVSVSVVASKSGNCPDDTFPETAATIDGHAYYVGYVHGRHTFLKLRSAGFETLYVALPDASPVDSNNEYVRRDVSLNDLRFLTKHSLNGEMQCIMSPSGIAMRFDPGVPPQ